MREIPSLIAYPVFRLTISMAAGIFLLDCFSTYSGHRAISVSAWIILWAVFVGMLLVLLAVYRKNTYAKRIWFGILTTLSFALFGALRLAQESQKIIYNWEPGRGVYWGEVQTPPVRKGKMMQAEIRVGARLYARDSLSEYLSMSDSVSQNTAQPEIPAVVGRSVVSSRFLAYPVCRTILLYWSSDSLQHEVDCGDHLLFSTEISVPISDEELTGFDYASYLYRKGISGTALSFAGEWKVVKRTENLTLKQRALSYRKRIVDTYRSWNLSDEEFAVVSALTVGDKSMLTTSLKEMYSAAGVSHVLALSGLHVGILSAILLFLLAPLKRIRQGERIRSIVVVASLWSFAFISGLSPSVVRAVTMCTLYFLATCFLEGKFPSVYALCLAAFVMLVYQPLYLFDLSFQLSFLAVTSILYFYPIFSICWGVRNKVVNWLWNGVSVSVSAQLGTLPLILYYFGTFPTYFLLANLVVSVLAVCVLSGAIAGLFVSSLPYIGPLVVTFIRHTTWSLNSSIRWIQELSGSQLDTLSISLLQSLCGFLFLYGLYRFITKRKAIYVVCMLLSFNLTLGDWVRYSLAPVTTSLYYSRSHLYLKQNRDITELSSANGLFKIDSLRIGIFNDGSWNQKEADRKIELDYLFLSRGFRGNLKSLLRVFTIRTLILDTSLSPRYRKYLKNECKEMKIHSADVSEKGSYRILL